MKKLRSILSIMAILAIVSSVSAQKGIDFFHGSLQEAQQVAQEEGKLIFIDAYATWCGPCKWMSANTFTDVKAGRFFNDNFINLKIDMEKGEGPGLAKRFGVNAYPTLVFLDASGNVIAKDEGARDANGLIKLGKSALDKSPRPDEVLNPDPDAPILVEIPDENSPQPIYPDEKRPAQPEPDGNTIEAQLKEALDSRNWDRYDAIAAEVLRSNQPQKEAIFLETHRAWATSHGDTENFVLRTRELMQSSSQTDPDLLNNAAWYYYELLDDRQSLETASAWAIRSVRLSPAFHNCDTYAMLQYKLGNTDMAVVFAERAIELAKRDGKDYSATAKALSKMKSTM